MHSCSVSWSPQGWREQNEEQVANGLKLPLEWDNIHCWGFVYPFWALFWGGNLWLFQGFVVGYLVVGGVGFLFFSGLLFLFVCFLGFDFFFPSYLPTPHTKKTEKQKEIQIKFIQSYFNKTNCVCWKQLYANAQLLDNWGVPFSLTKMCCFAPVVWQAADGVGSLCSDRDALWWVYIRTSRELRLNTANKSWPIWWEQIASGAASYSSRKKPCTQHYSHTSDRTQTEPALHCQSWEGPGPTPWMKTSTASTHVWKHWKSEFKSPIVTLVLTISLVSVALFLPQGNAPNHQSETPDLL